MTDINYERLKERLLYDEGLIKTPYLCSAGYVTIGIGRNLETNPLTELEIFNLLMNSKGSHSVTTMEKGEQLKFKIEIERDFQENPLTKIEAFYLLTNDIERVREELFSNFQWMTELRGIRQEALINMVFNLGLNGFRKFKKTIKFLKTEQYSQASFEMLDSKWANQVGKRANRLSTDIREG